MFKSLRLKLSASFVLLSALVFLLFAALSMALFQAGLTAELDNEMRELAQELLLQIDMKGDRPRLADPGQSLPATVQIYSAAGTLCQQAGPPGPQLLSLKASEFDHGGVRLRSYCLPLARSGSQAGYLQIWHSTRTRDRAVNRFAYTLAMVAPFLLAALGAAGYLYSGRAVRPVEETLSLLRRFMADAGHEIATPLSIIQVNAESVQEELESRGITAAGLTVITKTTGRLNNLVQDLALLSRLEAPRISSQQEKVDLSALVSSSVEEFRELFRERGIALSSSISPSVAVEGNTDSLKRVVTNLLANALRYTDPGGTTDVRLESDGNKIRLQVADSGIGIPAECIAHIFDRFYRVESSRARALGGSGLGLSIVRAIVESQGGRIDVESQVGKGSRFTVVLPAIS